MTGKRDTQRENERERERERAICRDRTREKGERVGKKEEVMPILVVQNGVCESPRGELGLQVDEELEHALTEGDRVAVKVRRRVGRERVQDCKELIQEPGQEGGLLLARLWVGV